jgi:hypothetical protein
MKKNYVLFIAFLILSLLFLQSCGNDSQTEKKSSTGKGIAANEARLPDKAYKAEISCADPTLNLRPSQIEVYKIAIKNISPVAWPAKGSREGRFQTVLGNHWLDQDGKTVIHDQARTFLPSDLNPDESATLSIKVIAPPTPGQYKLVFDMLQEGVTWFAIKGSKVLSFDVAVK